MAALNVLTGVLRESRFELTAGDAPAILGRGTEDVDIRVPDQAISRKHAQFTFENGRWHVQDLNSANGTFVNEVRIHHTARLSANDQVRCGSTVLLYQGDESESLLDEAAGPGQIGPIELVFDPGETMVAVAFDSLQSKQAAQQKKRMMEAGQVAMNLSHGIKNILQALRSGQDVMDDAIGYRDVDQAKKAWIILKRNLEKVQKLVLDMLKFSKDDKPRPQDCQLNRLVESVVETLRPQADEKQITMTFQADEQLEPVQVDPDQMQDVIMNLLINAIEAVGPQHGHITVHTETAPDRRHVIFRVTDNGRGIADTRIIFEPFHSDKANIGAGLGLTIANKIIKLHGGVIHVESIPGEGSIFTVILPLN